MLVARDGEILAEREFRDNSLDAPLAQPFEDEPGGRMLYSTGSTHLLSAILTQVTGRSTLDLARDWLGPVEGFEITYWQQDPQGIHFGGNQMSMSPRSLLRFGELYRNGGVAGHPCGTPHRRGNATLSSILPATRADVHGTMKSGEYHVRSGFRPGAVRQVPRIHR